jgi:general secretion pathway protein F
MLAVAERTGAMSEMLERAAAFHERELARWLERATRLFEPALMAMMGLVIGAIVVLMYMPIFDLAGSLG